MRFALLGNHPDGLAMAEALAATGRHELIVVSGTEQPTAAPRARVDHDLESVLAEPGLDLVIVAGGINVRGQQLRRAVQSEHGVVCVHPADERPDIAYEAALIQADTKRLLLPLMPDVTHPAYIRIRELLGDSHFQLLQCERRGTPEPSWEILRRLGGEIVEVTGLAPTEEIDTSRPLLAAGRFEKGGLFQFRSLPGSGEQRLVIHADRQTLELEGPDESGRAKLTSRDATGTNEQTWGPLDRWQRLVEIVECAEPLSPLTWQDEIRSTELSDALRRSVEKRRASSLEYQEISEEVGSKGTLTLIGCGMIWMMLLVFGLSIWVPAIRWAIVPMLLAYLVLLGASWLARKPTP